MQLLMADQHRIPRLPEFLIRPGIGGLRHVALQPFAQGALCRVCLDSQLSLVLKERIANRIRPLEVVYHPPGDPQALRQAIECLLDDAGLAERMGQAGKDKSNEFRASAIVPRIEQVYRQLVEQ